MLSLLLAFNSRRIQFPMCYLKYSTGNWNVANLFTSERNTQPWTTPVSWWRHQMETFSALLALCAGNSPVAGEFPAQRPVTWSFDVFFSLHLNKRLSKQSWGWWFEMPSRSLWRHCNVVQKYILRNICAVRVLSCFSVVRSSSPGDVALIFNV